MHLPLLFAFASRIGVVLAAASNEDREDLECHDIHHSRTLWSIILSCLTTIFFCTWVAIHPNIPEPIDMRHRSLLHRCFHGLFHLIRDRFPIFVCALLIPEYILAWSIRQRHVATIIERKYKDLGFTKAHGFFIIMGGFHYFRNPCRLVFSEIQIDYLNPRIVPIVALTADDRSQISIESHADEIPQHPLDAKEVAYMVKNNMLMLPTEPEIQDKSKSDWLGKTLVLTQTLWFVMQCITRRIEHLPTTELEIVTLAYTILNFGIFLAWWDKPRSVDCPIRVLEKPPIYPSTASHQAKRLNLWNMIMCIISGMQDDNVDLHARRKVPSFYSGHPEIAQISSANCITLAVSAIFGAIHCIAWSFEFGSPTEILLWRISAIIITCTPVLVVLGVSYLSEFECILALFMLILVVVYTAARVTTIVVAFLNLIHPSPGVLQAVHWPSLFPHL